jgi:hypothetical protein
VLECVGTVTQNAGRVPQYVGIAPQNAGKILPNADPVPQTVLRLHFNNAIDPFNNRSIIRRHVIYAPLNKRRINKNKMPVTEMSTRNISWGVKAASAYDSKPYHLQRAS